MRNLKLYNITWTVILLILIVLSIVWAYISADAPYYLSISRDIANGLIPYKDIDSIYTPLMMYINSLLHWLIEDPSYYVFLVFQYFIIFLSSLTLFFICRNYDVKKNPSFFLSLFLFITVLGSEGTNVNLEVYVLLIVLISFLLLMKKHFIWTGFVLALGFFAKQYGILNFVPFFFLVLLQGDSKNNIIQFLFGAVLPLLIFLTYYSIIESVSIVNLFEQLSGRGYGQRSVTRPKTFISLLAGFKVFLLLLIPMFFLGIRPFKNKFDGILILGILVNLIPILIQHFSHYFILTFPFIFVLMARNYENFNHKFINSSNVILVVIAVLLFLRINRYKDVYDEQLKIAEKYKKEYPVSSEVFLVGEIRYLYILNDYQNPVLSEVGYSYDFEPDEEFNEKYDVLSLE